MTRSSFSRIACVLLFNAFAVLHAADIWSDEPVILEDESGKLLPNAIRIWDQKVYPIGNGRIGATFTGLPARERIQFNEDSLWVGNEDNTGAYQPFGDVIVEFPHKEFDNYRRELDIRRAVHTVTYRSGGVTYKRESFASFPAQVMVFRFTADKPGALTGRISLDNLHEIPTNVEGDSLVLKGDTGNFFFWKLQLSDPKRLFSDRQYASDKLIVLDFEARVRVLNEGGMIRADQNTIAFDNCDALTLILAADTNYLNRRDQGWRGDHPHERVAAQITAASKRPYAGLLDEHIADYRKMFGRMSINLGASPAETTSLPTAKRVALYADRFKQKAAPSDPELEALMVQYARYLMISCSRPGHGAMPANLQGLWLVNKRPPWRSDYHTDINLQMNYWFTGPSNLHECFIPLAEWIDSIRDVRKEETRRVLGVERGWLMRSENGVFGGSTWHIQKGDSAWLCQNLWDHYLFTQDKDFLSRYAYPVMREISEFWVDHLKELPDGTLVAPKGRSPEHGPVDVDGVTYDQALCWDLFSNTIEASKVLGLNNDQHKGAHAEFRKELIAKRDKLLKPKIGRWGQLQEWMEDIDDPKDDHRHNNHLIGVHPGRQIHPTTTPEWAEAAKVSLIARGNGPTGWSKIWKSCIFARLLDAERSHFLLSDVIASKTYGNLWTTHPPFQIDCNFGFPAAVSEMLVQSHMGEIHLLPALPKAWPDGKVTGMRVRGGYELDLAWKSGKLHEAVLRAMVDQPDAQPVRYGDGKLDLDLAKGGSKTITASSFAPAQ